MTWKKFWLYTAISLLGLVMLGLVAVQTRGGFDNPDLLCDMAVRVREC